jgi:polyisoprenoid-binding protein YceI
MIDNNNSVKWAVDVNNTTISFKISHLMISNIIGHFKTFDANIYTTKNDFTTAQIDAFIDAESITTGDDKRDEHLKGISFFDVEHFKQITFTSTNIEKSDKHGKHELWGVLTIKGISKNVLFEIYFGGQTKDLQNKERAGFSLNGKIKRSDWELTWNESLPSGNAIIGNDILINCEIELVKEDKNNLTIELEESTNYQIQQ